MTSRSCVVLISLMTVLSLQWYETFHPSFEARAKHEVVGQTCITLMGFTSVTPGP